MDSTRVSKEILAALGGKENIQSCDVLMTRLRIVVVDAAGINTTRLSQIRGVLGFVKRSDHSVEIVFGPGNANPVYREFSRFIKDKNPPGYLSGDPDQSRYSQASLIEVHIAPSSFSATTQVPAAYLEDTSMSLTMPHIEEVENLMGMLDYVSYENGTATAASGATACSIDASPDTPARLSDSAADVTAEKHYRLLVLNGPNINMLGIHEPEIYGENSYARLLELCKETAKEAGFEDCSCFQSNHEGDLIEAIQDAYGAYDGIVFNPGAYTHTSIALLDAALSVHIPMIEVQISNTDEQEDFRKISYIRSACFSSVIGMGIEGYRKAICEMGSYLGI